MAGDAFEDFRSKDEHAEKQSGFHGENYLNQRNQQRSSEGKAVQTMQLTSADELLAGFGERAIKGGPGAEAARRRPENDGPIKKDENGNITDVVHPDGSRHHVDYKNGKPSELVQYDQKGKEIGRSKAGPNLELSVKEDGTIEKKNIERNTIKGPTTYDRLGRPLSQRVSETSEVLSTETIRPNGTTRIENHRDRSVTEIKQDGSRVENRLNGERRETTPDGKTTTFLKDKHSGNEVKITPDGKYFVKGADGEQREFVDASAYEQKPAGPTRFYANGGKVVNQSDKPILVVGKGPGHEGNSHGDGFLRILKPGDFTDPEKTDYDGVVTDSRFQPVTLPDGKVLMPASVPADAKYTKISDSYTAHVNFSGADVQVTSPNWTNGLTQTEIDKYTGGAPIHPQKPGEPKARRQ